MTGFDGGDDPDLLVRSFGARALPGMTGAWLKDGMHDMAVVLVHDGVRVTGIRGWTHGYPWTTCPDAAVRLEDFIGAAIGGPPRPAGVDQTSQCTHLLDLARLAMLQTARGGRTHYRLSIRRTSGDGVDRLDARAFRDGGLTIDWRLEDYVVVEPTELRGHQIDGRAIWPDRVARDPDWFEAAMMLRRAVKMFRGRDRAFRMSVDIPPEERGWMMGACYTFQPLVAPHARRAP